jgi:hypothetical protein
VFSLPTVTLDNFATVCNGLQTFSLTGGNPIGGTYAGSGVVGGNQFDPTLNGAGNFQITYSYNDSNNCTNTASQNLSVVNLSVNAGSDQTITCGNTAQLNTSVNYTGTGTITYSWSPAQGLSNTTIANPIASPGVNTTYIVQISDGLCSDADTVNVIYNPISFGISFTASPLAFSQLPPYVVNFTNPYAALGQYNFTWIFGDGFTQFNNAQNFFCNAELGFYFAGYEDLFITNTFQVISDPSFKIVQVGNFFREPKKFFGRLFLEICFNNL